VRQPMKQRSYLALFHWSRQCAALYPKIGLEYVLVLETELYLGSLGVHYGQFYIEAAVSDLPDNYVHESHASIEDSFTNQKNGLCGATAKDKLFFVTGIHTGLIQISVVLYQAEPIIDNNNEDIVEVSFQVGEYPVSLCEWAHEETHRLELAKGSYRLRYIINGMDKDHEDSDDLDLPVPGQEHILQFWLAPGAKDSVIKQSSENAKYWHNELGT